jgi:hypothetical protein
MSRKSRFGKFAPLFLILGALLLPASSALADGGPSAHKSGAIVNYTKTGKLKVAKHMFIYFTCSVTCDATSTTTIKGLGGKFTIPASGQIPAGIQGVLQLTIKGPLLKLMKERPGAFKLINHINVTDPATGATDQIAHSFKLKR